MSTEKYETPKELSDTLYRIHGLSLAPQFIREVRAESIARGETLFVIGMARPGELLQWLQANPTFHPYAKPRPAVS